MPEASYLKLRREGKLQDRIDRALERLARCTLCPRRCGINRLADERGFCKTGRRARVASAQPHFGEEPPLVGRNGSGTIFFSSCNLLCSFCQNYDISHTNGGFEVTPEDLAELMIRLARGGCHNINFVTPTHVVPQILEALPLAIEKGLRVPLVYNSGGYDLVSTLNLLEEVFDIYMPDFKFWDSRWADVFCQAPDYRQTACQALREMHRQVGDLVINSRGIAVKGVLVRHLVMPREVAGTREIMGFLACEISTRTYVNVMDQYRPCYRASSDPIISRRITGTEYQRALEWAKDAGLKRLDKRARF